MLIIRGPSNSHIFLNRNFNLFEEFFWDARVDKALDHIGDEVFCVFRLQRGAKSSTTNVYPQKLVPM